MEHLLFVLGEEDWNHFFAVSESLLPVSVVQICLDVLLLTVFVLFYNEFFKGVLEHATENPLFQDLEVWQGGFLKKESEKVSDGRVRAADHELIDHIEKGAAFFVSCVDCQPLQVVHDSNTVLQIEPDLLQSQVGFHELSVKLCH